MGHLPSTFSFHRITVMGLVLELGPNLELKHTTRNSGTKSTIAFYSRDMFEHIFKYIFWSPLKKTSSNTFGRKKISFLCIIKNVMTYPFIQKPKFQTQICNPTLVLVQGSLAYTFAFYLFPL